MMGAYSAVSHGHRHPRLVAALTRQLSQLAVVSRAYYSEPLGLMLEELVTISGLDAALPMNTGAEAVETGIKAVRRHAYMVAAFLTNAPKSSLRTEISTDARRRSSDFRVNRAIVRASGRSPREPVVRSATPVRWRRRSAPILQRC